jgi:hypothetical protein
MSEKTIEEVIFAITESSHWSVAIEASHLGVKVKVSSRWSESLFNHGTIALGNTASIERKLTCENLRNGSVVATVLAEIHAKLVDEECRNILARIASLNDSGAGVSETDIDALNRALDMFPDKLPDDFRIFWPHGGPFPSDPYRLVTKLKKRWSVECSEIDGGVQWCCSRLPVSLPANEAAARWSYTRLPFGS